MSKSASKDSIGSNQASSKASPEPEEVQPIKNESESEQQQQETEPVPATESAEADAGKEELPECDMTCRFIISIQSESLLRHFFAQLLSLREESLVRKRQRQLSPNAGDRCGSSRRRKLPWLRN